MKVSVITGVVAARDAISASTLDKIAALQEIAREEGEPLELRAYCHAAALPTPSLKLVSSVAEVVLDRHFVESDLLLYDFGIYSDLFDSIHLAPPRARKLVHFHNVTPPALMAPEQREVLERSLVQMLNLERADLVISSSEFNTRTLREHGIPEHAILPGNYVIVRDDGPAPAPRGLSPGQALQLVYVGRFVRAKGVLAAIRAARIALDAGAGPLRLSLVGNLAFSDPAYVQAMERAIRELRLEEVVRVLPSATDEERDNAYREAHALLMPSYHEGFCVPVVEALAAGCFVIASDAGNLPWVVAGLGRLVKAGDAAALGEEIAALARQKRAGQGVRTEQGVMSEQDFHEAALRYARTFSPAALKGAMRRALERAGLLRA